MEHETCASCGKPATGVQPGMGEDEFPVCDECMKKLEGAGEQMVQEFFGISEITQGVSRILKGLQRAYGLDIEDENFKNTPRRVARAYAEIFRGIKDTDKQVKAILATSFPSDVKEMIVVQDVRVYSMCPHHLLPVEYNITIGYVSKKHVLGVSKLARLAEILAKRPVLQESLTEDIAEKLFTGVDAQGVGVWVEGVHYCMKMRGAKQPNSKTVTSAIRGCFEDQEVRAEFLSLVNGGRR